MREPRCTDEDHVFLSDDDGAYYPDTFCRCGEFTWGEMDRRLEIDMTLEAMWNIPSVS